MELGSLPRKIVIHNEERFLLSGAAHRRCRGRTAFGAAPVSKKRIGLNRAPRLPMGFV